MIPSDVHVGSRYNTVGIFDKNLLEHCDSSTIIKYVTLEVVIGICSNCSRLEKVQLEAGRIVTGLPSFASIHSIYIETGWEQLKTRRDVRKLVLFYKIVNGQVPDYLTELVPPTVAE